jgi:hypothetical protein
MIVKLQDDTHHEEQASEQSLLSGMTPTVAWGKEQVSEQGHPRPPQWNLPEEGDQPEARVKAIFGVAR